LEKHKDDVYNLNIKIKKSENLSEVLQRDHKDEVERVVAELKEQNRKQHELIVK
jgi:hypothetical protein